jgi:ribosomal protein S18 acetylase RimI-like enzyme
MMMKKVLGGLLIFLAAGAALYFYGTPYFFVPDKNGIRLYQQADKEFVRAMFAHDWRTMVSEEYDLDFTLDHATSSQWERKHDMIMKVMQEDGRVVGYSAVYKKAQFWGRILFIIVDKEYRGKGYAKALVMDALRYLFFDQDCLKVTLLTRQYNTAAQILYEKVGFTVYEDDEYDKHYVFYRDDFIKKYGK